MPFRLPNQQCRSTEEALDSNKKYTSRSRANKLGYRVACLDVPNDKLSIDSTCWELLTLCLCPRVKTNLTAHTHSGISVSLTLDTQYIIKPQNSFLYLYDEDVATGKLLRATTPAKQKPRSPNFVLVQLTACNRLLYRRRFNTCIRHIVVVLGNYGRPLPY